MAKIKTLIESNRSSGSVFRILEAGAEAGTLDIGSTSVEKAREFAEKGFKDSGRDLSEEIPDFDKNYKVAKAKAATGKTVRKDMPVIDADDVNMFNTRLKKGVIDIKSPYKDSESKKDPFPKGLSPATAKNWLTNGLKKFDGEENDDKIPVSTKPVAVKNLKPIQKQIYYDKSMSMIAKFGVEASAKFMQKTTFITSKDNFIIDGHHRYLSAMLLDPNMKVTAMMIDLPISQLLPMTLSYGDAIGNKRNA